MRVKHLSAKRKTFESVWIPEKLKPSKNTYELIVDIENLNASDFGIKICVSEDNKPLLDTTMRMKISMRSKK